jgi:ribosomal-protein-alanine N-acetyltransferase
MALPLLETPRLLLRPSAHADLDALHRLWTDPKVRRYLWDNVIIPKERTASFLQESVECFERHGFGQWTVCFRGYDSLIGFCGFRFLDNTPEIEILYGMAPAYWGQGLATEAAAAVLRYGFDVLRFTRVVADADPPNVASFRVMEKLGMRYTRRGYRHNVEVITYTLARADFQPQEAWYQVRYAAG